MKESNTEIKTYSKQCPKCKKEIKGYSESQVEYNLKLHLDSHNKEVKQ